MVNLACFVHSFDTWFPFESVNRLFSYRWLVYDAEWKEDDGRKVGKILLLAYSPDANPDASSKFVIPNSLGAIK